jgi:hypothetical protein
MRIMSKCLIAAAAIGMSFTMPAGAAPMAAPSGLQQAAAANAGAQVQTVQWRRGWRGGYRGGPGWIGPAIVGGALLGGAIVATQPYAYGGYYGSAYPGYYDDYAYAPGYTAPAPVYRDSGDDDAYCARRFRSYDPDSQSYMGYDGMRHPCP